MRKGNPKGIKDWNDLAVKELAQIVERMLLDAGNIKRLAQQFSQREEGRLVVATPHTQARYVLPAVVTRFMREFPKAHLVLHQANPAEIVALLNAGEADLGIATEAVEGMPTLEAIADYPIITRIAVQRDHYLRGYAYRFIEYCSGTLTETVVKNAVAPSRAGEVE